MITTPSPLPPFDTPVLDRGYKWWYFDASSSDGQHHLVVIAFVGSVFSPFYKRAVARGRADPMQYCAINVALYSRQHARWVMTEPHPSKVERGADHFYLGNTQLVYRQDAIEIIVNDRAAPLPFKVQGRIVVHPHSLTSTEYELDARRQHRWWPVSPRTRVELEFEKPDIRWSGDGYFDSNQGDEPLHEGFNDWHWSRTHERDHTRIEYHARDRHDAPSALSLQIRDDGQIAKSQPAVACQLPATRLWRAPRTAHLMASPKISQTLEDTPFYARSLLSTGADRSHTMHESLSLARFRANWVTTLIPFRMRFPFVR
ncbi:MAG: carotenoid 1,2-hydratase [Pseudomonadota bacterium]